MNGNGGVITGMLDHQQVKTLYEQHGRVLLAYAVSLLPDRAASEDVLHQVFVKLLQGNVGINGSPVRYLYRAIRNAAFNSTGAFADARNDRVSQTGTAASARRSTRTGSPAENGLSRWL